MFHLGMFCYLLPRLFLAGFFPGKGLTKISDGAPKITTQAPDSPGPKQDDNDYQDNE